jgi:hypothetical protein
MSPRNQRRRDRRAIKAAARKADRAIRIHAKRAFFDFETIGLLDRSPFQRDDRSIVITHAGQSQVSPFAAVDLNIVHHPALVVDTFALVQGMTGRKS